MTTNQLRRRAVLLGAGAAALAGCEVFLPSWTLRFRVTVNLVADGEVIQGAGVFKVIYTRNSEIMRGSPTGFTTRAWGEAITIDAGERGLLFGLLGRVAGVDGPYFDPGLENLLTGLLPREQLTADETVSGRVFDMLQEHRGVLTLPKHRWPTFVRFSDLENVSTARVVIPEGQEYRLSSRTPHEMAGALGVRVTGVTVEVTHDQRSHQIERLLPWVRELPGANPGPYDLGWEGDPLAKRFDYGQFVRDGDRR